MNTEIDNYILGFPEEVQPILNLIRKTINRFMQMNIKTMEYIRNYANYISKFRLKYLQDIGIPKNLTSNEILNHTNNNIINKSIIKYHQQTTH
jgi:hypothetical protein